MAALSLGHSSLQIQRLKSRNCPRIVTFVSCQRGEPMDKGKKEMKQEKQFLLGQICNGVEKFGKGMKDNLSPKQKGDWKDVVLMSLSFAVYVYISQQIVCLYCAWTSMPKQQW